MSTENAKRKIWHRCFGNVEALISEYAPYFSDDQSEDIRNYLISNKNSMLVRSSDPEQFSPDQIIEFEKDVSQKLKHLTYEKIIGIALPIMKEKHTLLENAVQQIEQLKRKVQRGGYKSLGSLASGWMGADVVVTSDSSIDPHKSHDKIVLINNPRPLSKLMEALRDICTPYLNYATKYEFYGRIADMANQYIAKNGDPGNEQKEMLVLILEDVIQVIIKEITFLDQQIDKLVKV